MSVFVITGPTGAGKTDLAIEVADAFGAVVLSCDAMQVYRRMDIGTGKATPAQRARVPHEGLDLVEPHESFDARDFVTLADRVRAEHRRVVVCGGTSLYLQALQRGLVDTPPVDAALRAELSALPDPHGALAEVDPELAARLHPNDLVRVIRGLEVWHQLGQRLSALQATHAAAPDRVPLVGLRLDQPDLDARIDARVLGMMDAGYVDEVRALLDAGVSRDLKPMRSLGYRHLADHLLDGLPLDEAVRRTQRDTRSFARKQRTWANALPLPAAAGDARSQALALASDLFDE